MICRVCGFTVMAAPTGEEGVSLTSFDPSNNQPTRPKDCCMDNFCAFLVAATSNQKADA